MLITNNLFLVIMEIILSTYLLIFVNCVKMFVHFMSFNTLHDTFKLIRQLNG